MPADRPTLVFDLESKFLAEEVGGWDQIHRLGLSAAVVLDTTSGLYTRYTEAEAGRLIDHLRSAGLVIGYNILRFDYRVLEPYGGEGLAALPTIDLLDHLHRALGFRLALDSVAEATLGEAKSGEGTLAVQWYRAGEIEKVLDYCQKDVELTWRVYEHGRTHHQVSYRDRSYRKRSVSVAW
jgi:DEAD/DEAH box helicase domain-containing protein